MKKDIYKLLEDFIENVFILVLLIILTPMGWIGMLIFGYMMGWVD